MAGLLVKFAYWISPSTTNIDRSKCRRTVPLEVLVLGLSRTGTTSMRAGLRTLGYHDVYHMAAPMAENPRDAEMWVPAYRAKYQGQGKLYGREEFDKLLGHCMAVADVPCIHFGTDLIEAYPEAKVILTIRDSPEAWLKSVKSTLIPVTMEHAKLVQDADGMGPLDRAKKAFTPRMPFEALSKEMLVMTGQAGPQALRSFSETTAAEYTEHCERIRACVARRNERLVARGRAADATPLLEFNVKSGWAPLCEFLQKPVPRAPDGRELPFPRLNDTKDFLSTGAMVRRMVNILVCINVLLVGVGVYAFYRLLVVLGPAVRVLVGH